MRDAAAKSASALLSAAAPELPLGATAQRQRVEISMDVMGAVNSDVWMIFMDDFYG